MADVAVPGDVEHVAVHAAAHVHLVLGVFLLAGRLEEAEEVALTACRRMLDRRPELAGWTVVEGHVPLLAPVYDALNDGDPADVA
ncbi:hypothetical protein ACFUJR_11375 [Streptomyces sp. NPDC057271]|uniref:hypothetical protein n=1 Tax=unclassified Streptomyces TaxID=2593676 RepID=UPI00363C2E47